MNTDKIAISKQFPCEKKGFKYFVFSYKNNEESYTMVCVALKNEWVSKEF